MVSLLILLLPALPLLALALWVFMYKARPRLALGLVLGLMAVLFILWVWLAATVPTGDGIGWSCRMMLFESPLAMRVDPLSALLGLTLSGMALLAVVFWSANGCGEQTALLLWSLASLQLVLTADHPLLLWTGWTALPVALLIALRGSTVLALGVASAALGNVALVFGLLRLQALADRGAPIAVALSLAVAGHLGLYALFAEWFGRQTARAGHVLALGLLGMLPSALYLLLRYWPYWGGEAMVATVFQWAAVAAMWVALLRAALDNRALSILSGWWVIELLLLMSLLPHGDPGLIAYQVVALILSGGAALWSLWMLGSAVQADRAGAAIVSALVAGLLFLVELGVPWSAGYGGRVTILGQVALDRGYLLLGLVCLATFLVARLLAGQVLQMVRGGSTLQGNDVPIRNCWAAWLPPLVALAAVIGLGAGRRDLLTWLGLGAPLWQIDLSPLGRALAWVPTLLLALGVLSAWSTERKRDRWRVDGSAQTTRVTLAMRPRVDSGAWERLRQALIALDPTALPNEILACIVCLIVVIVMLWGVG